MNVAYARQDRECHHVMRSERQPLTDIDLYAFTATGPTNPRASGCRRASPHQARPVLRPA